MRIKLAAVIVAAALMAVMLSGCKRTDYAENKAYAVMLGADITDENTVKLSIRYPKLSGGTGGNGSEGGSSYSTESAEGATFQQALDALRTTVPNDISLSALTMVVISENTIYNGKLEHVMEGLSANYRMYSSAYIAVCSGEASGFIEKQEPLLGSRLSENLKAIVENSGELGNIPESRLADVYYRMNSVYSAPMIMRCFTEDPADGGESGNEKQDAKNKNRFEGAYMLADYKNAVYLTAEQSLMANVLNGDVKQFMYSNDTAAASLSVEEGPEISIEKDEKLHVGIAVGLSGMLMNSGGDMAHIAQAIRGDIIALMDMCKNVGAEPFGFADRAAAGFAEMDDWIEYDWAEQFSDCEFEVDVVIKEVF